MMESLKSLRFVLLLAAWGLAVLQVITWHEIPVIGNTGGALFMLYLVLTLPFIRKDSVIIIGFIGLLGFLFIREMPSLETWMGGSRFILIFAGLVPTMALVKATALTMPSVQRTQKELAALPPEASAAGLQLAGHAFGGIINTGTFAMLSAALPRNSSFERRRLAAMAALRGMNAAAVWSPFFVAFAIGQSFTGAEASWQAIGYGVLTAFLFTLISLFVFTPGLTMAIIRRSLACLRPVALRLAAVLFSVLGVALSMGFTALSAVVVVMPVLVIIQFFRQPRHVRTILDETRLSVRSMADDLAVIGTAMMLGYLVTRTDAISQILAVMPTDTFPAAVALISTPVLMMLGSVIGIHPVISSTVLLALFSGSGSTAAPALLMQAHLIGWAAGTMSSIASLSVITCTTLYRVPGRDLALGANVYTAFALAFGGGLMLTGIDLMIR
ncbi:MAG: hypothetical protein ACON4P_00935 [Candidatus Puniceispirillales bacterium]